MKIVVEIKGRRGVQAAAVEGKSSPISYASIPAEEMREEGKMIERYKLNFNPKG